VQVRLTIIWLALALTIVALTGGCGGHAGTPTLPSAGQGASPAPGAFPVVVTLPVFVSMTEAVAGPHATVRSIVPAGVDAHTYQPTPRDVKAIAAARVILVNGFGIDGWLGGMIASAGSAKAPVVELAEGLTPLEGDAEEHEGNPHFWLDPDNAIGYVERIAGALIAQDPANAADYRANADRYSGQIRDFDAWAKAQIATIPAERRKIVTFHDAYPYFGRHFGLQIVGFVVASPGRDPSARELAKLIDAIKREGVPAIFTEPQFNPKQADTLAKEAGVKRYVLYSDSPAKGDGYLEMMRKNVTNVVDGLR
jgi:ABC-type Zn uptake system ZnuABC Zn-binding protein ZnuA